MESRKRWDKIANRPERRSTRNGSCTRNCAAHDYARNNHVSQRRDRRSKPLGFEHDKNEILRVVLIWPSRASP